MMRLTSGGRARRAVVGALVALGAPATADAQSMQLWSVQGSGLVAALQGSAYGNLGPGYGGEAQVRFTPGAFSVGAGGQYTRHDFALPGGTFPVSLSGAFVEPRYVFATRFLRLGPYVSTRFSFLRQHYRVAGFEGRSSSGVTLNAGGGVLVRMLSRVNVDLGATYGYTRFHEFSLEDLETGEQTALPAGAGSNLVLRLGAAIGIGR